MARIRAGLAANLSVLPDIQVSPYLLANPTPPVVCVIPGETTWDYTYGRGYDQLTMRVQLFVSLNLDVASQQTLDKYQAGSGALSVKQAIEAEETLGGVADSTSVVSTTGPQLFTRADGVAVLMAEWNVQVIARGVQ
jgi:hypothetical protein